MDQGNIYNMVYYIILYYIYICNIHCIYSYIHDVNITYMNTAVSNNKRAVVNMNSETQHVPE